MRQKKKPMEERFIEAMERAVELGEKQLKALARLTAVLEKLAKKK